MRSRFAPARVPTFIPALAIGSLAFVGVTVRAAGGHFDVDDAAVLAPGRCQYELWANRAPRADANDLHLGPACRLGPFEIGLDLDRASVAGDSGFAVGPHLKWVRPLVADRLVAGVVVGTSYDLRSGGRPAQALYFPATWTVSPVWAFNLNFGWDRSSDGISRRAGVSAEWSPAERWTVIGEHARIGRSPVARLGVRFALRPTLSLDLSAARVGALAGSLYTLGVNHEFAR